MSSVYTLFTMYTMCKLQTCWSLWSCKIHKLINQSLTTKQSPLHLTYRVRGKIILSFRNKPVLEDRWFWLLTLFTLFCFNSSGNSVSNWPSCQCWYLKFEIEVLGVGWRSLSTFGIGEYLAQSRVTFWTLSFCNINNYTSCTTQEMDDLQLVKRQELL